MVALELGQGGGEDVEREAFDVEKREAGGVMRSQDAREGPRAFKERREPTFEGR